MFDGEDDADWDSDEIRFVFAGGIFVFDGRIDQDEANVFITLVTGALIEVKRVREENRVKFEAPRELFQFVRREGRGQVYPAARIWLGQLDQAAFFSCIITGHCPWVGFCKL